MAAASAGSARTPEVTAIFLGGSVCGSEDERLTRRNPPRRDEKLLRLVKRKGRLASRTAPGLRSLAIRFRTGWGQARRSAELLEDRTSRPDPSVARCRS